MDLTEYLADCPEVAEKIKKKEIKKDAFVIASAYNAACGDGGSSDDE